MTSTKYGLGQLTCGAGGALLIASLFLPWAGANVNLSGWELWAMADVFLLVVGLFAIGAALTGGCFGLFRPDLSLSGAADLLGVVTTILLAWLVIFDFPAGSTREVGVFLALIGALAVAAGAGDYATLRGAPLLPRTGQAAGPRTK